MAKNKIKNSVNPCQSVFAESVLVRVLFIALIINMQTEVTARANRKLTAVCVSLLFIIPAKIFSEAAKAAIKTIKGTKNATTALRTTGGLLLSLN